MRIGPRPLFFLILAAINVVLIPPTPTEFRWVNVAMAALALLWAVLLTIEEIASRRDHQRRSQEHEERKARKREAVAVPEGGPEAAR